MKEILPGVWHWTAPHPNLGGKAVSLYWLDSAGVAIDPLLVNDEQLDWLAQRPVPPTAIVLCNRHHYRDSGRINERFGCAIHVPAAGLHAFTQGQPVTGYAPAEELPGGLVAVQVGALSPDDGGLYREASSALWLADTAIRSPADPDARIGWVPDWLMDDPPDTKRGLIAAFERVLGQFQFEHLLLAHGLPLIGNGRTELEELVRDGGRTATAGF
jgi:hypothetical protein